MDLTKELEAEIDAMSYEDLLRGIRFAPQGSPMHQGQTGTYWIKRMQDIKPEDSQEISDKVGYDNDRFKPRKGWL